MNYYDFALKDYKMMKLAYSSSDDYDSIVVMGQQYLEKAFKRLLEVKCGEIYKNHKITVIVQKLGIPDFLMHEDYFRKIQDYYFDKRYPGENYIETSKSECDYLVYFIDGIKPVIESYLEIYSDCEENKNIADLKGSGIFKDL